MAQALGLCVQVPCSGIIVKDHLVSGASLLGGTVVAQQHMGSLFFLSGIYRLADVSLVQRTSGFTFGHQTLFRLQRLQQVKSEC